MKADDLHAKLTSYEQLIGSPLSNITYPRVFVSSLSSLGGFGRIVEITDLTAEGKGIEEAYFDQPNIFTFSLHNSEEMIVLSHIDKIEIAWKCPEPVNLSHEIEQLQNGKYQCSYHLPKSLHSLEIDIIVHIQNKKLHGGPFQVNLSSECWKCNLCSRYLSMTSPPRFNWRGRVCSVCDPHLGELGM